MKKFELVSNDLLDFKKGKYEDLMYEIKGNEKILKQIIYEKIKGEYDLLNFKETTLIKQLKLYVCSGDSETEIWLDFDTNNDLYPIKMNCDFTIDNVFKIKNTVIDWLLG